MTAIIACICGKYDESQDLENDYKDKQGPLNKHVFFCDFQLQINLSSPFSLNFFILFKDEATSHLHSN